MTTDVLVIGIGSANGADEIGWQVVGQLKDKLPPSTYDCINLSSTAGLLNLGTLYQYSIIHIVDALKTTPDRGAVVALKKEDLAGKEFTFSHGMDLKTVLELLETISNEKINFHISGISTGDAVAQSFKNDEIKLIATGVLEEIEALKQVAY